MTTDTVLYAAQGGVATITLNRPDKLNAFTEELHAGLIAAIGRATHDDAVRCLVLTGAGRAFCAGQDLAARAMAFREGGEGPDIGATLEAHYNPLIRTLRGIDKPVVAAVNGVAAGAGANVALACDIVLAARSAKFIQAFCRIGLVPDAGGTYHLPRLVGRARAFGLALLGDAIDAADAEKWGLIWKCVDSEALMDEAIAIANRLAAGPGKALGSIKQALNASPSNTLNAQLDLERDLQQACGKSFDYREGVTAFVEKRTPRFEGR